VIEAMRKRLPACAALLALLLGMPTLTAAATWSQLYAFGDSYSDSGAGYVDGNGPSAIAAAATELQIPFTYAGDPTWTNEGLNFAVSGAQTGSAEGRRRGEAASAGTRPPLLGRGVATQVGDFLSLVQNGKLRFDANRTLFFVAAGLNDSKLTTATTTANISNAVRRLYEAGARHVVIALLPEKIPAFHDVAVRLNPALADLPAQLRAALPELNVDTSQWGPYFDDVMARAAEYGITDTTNHCARRAIFQEDVRPCADPEAHYYYHSGHPSKRVHELVGRRLASEFQRPSAMTADAAPTIARQLPESALYSAGIPGARIAADDESVRNGSGFSSVTNVSRPTYTVYLPASFNASGTAVLVFPGGGYTALSIEKEGKLIAEWLQSLGVAAIVVKYRLPSDATMTDKAHGPLQDAQQAMLVVRAHAVEWGIDPHRVGLMGFSAGGHLAASAGTHFRASYAPNPGQGNVRPDFMMLVYPVITMNPDHTHVGSRNALLGMHADASLVRDLSNELQVTADTPPTLLLCAGDDSVVDVDNTLSFYRALQQQHVAATLHMFQAGQHGFPLLPRPVWLAHVQDWMELRGLLKLQR
jgi:acetyl esterase/lipase/phospholipase/lecithinase/hemolysin